MTLVFSLDSNRSFSVLPQVSFLAGSLERRSDGHITTVEYYYINFIQVEVIS